jgi:hypothetical protein
LFFAIYIVREIYLIEWYKFNGLLIKYRNIPR